MDFDVDTSMDMDADVPYPETLIIVITTHGKIEVETTFHGKKEPDTFAIPYDMTLTRINAVAPGVCNYLSVKTAQIIVDRVKEMAAKFDLRRGIPSNLITFLSKDFKRLTDIDRQTLKTNGYVGEDKADIQDFDTHYDKAYKNITHNGYAFALNKKYSIKTLSETYYDRILLLNTPEGDVDYFSTLKPPYETDLKSIVYYVRDKGVKNILLIDLSCAAFDDRTLTPRDVRSMRRDLREYKAGGLRKKKNSKKSKKGKKSKRDKKSKKKYKKKKRHTRKILR